VIGIDLLDHIIVGQRSKDPKDVGLFSFNEAGLI
jgi:DNA repair protein RadC